MCESSEEWRGYRIIEYPSALAHASLGQALEVLLPQHKCNHLCRKLRQEASRNKCIATSNKCLTSSNKKLVVTSASLLVTGALLVVTRS